MSEKKYVFKPKKKNIVCFLLGILVLFLTIGPFFYFTDYRLMQIDKEVLDEHWDMQINDRLYSDVNLSETVFPVVNRGDVIRLSRNVGNVKIIENPILRLYSVHSVVDVCLNDEEIYSYGKERYREGLMIGYGNHFIELPKDYANAKLEIVLTVTENDAFSGIPRIVIENGVVGMQRNISGDRVRLAGALLLITFGTFAMLISCIMIINNTKFIQFFCIATFSVLIGIWTMCNNDMIMYFSQNLLVKVYFEYMSLYSLPLPFLFYFNERVNVNYEKRKELSGRSRSILTVGKFAYWTLIIGQILFLVVIVVGQITNLTHLPMYLRASHIFMALDLIFVGIVFVESRRNKRPISKGILWGMVLVFAFVFYELLRYNIDKYLFHFNGNEYNSTLCFAALIVVFSLLIDFTSQITSSLYEEAEQQLLRQMAYEDKLTGLGNRRRSDDTLQAYEANGNDFAIVSIDLNLLKHYNDTFGHDKGDELLVCYAEILKEFEDGATVICRIGGDEFCLLIPDQSQWNQDLFLRKHDMLLAQTNERLKAKAVANGEKEILRLSLAMGIAGRHEIADGDCHAVMRLADQRMYENKRKMKDGER